MNTICTCRRTRMLLAAGLLAIVGSEGCAHRREAYYARDTGTGVNVRAPFVNVQVRGKSKADRAESASRERDRDRDEDDRKLSRLPVDREDND